MRSGNSRKNLSHIKFEGLAKIGVFIGVEGLEFGFGPSPDIVKGNMIGGNNVKK